MKAAIIPKWSLEVVKMFGYMMFPVIAFHYFNNPQIFEEEVTKLRRENQLPIPIEKQMEFKRKVDEMKAEINLRRIKKLEESDKPRLHN